MHEILLHLIALHCVIGEVCDVAVKDKARAGGELLKLEPRINKAFEEAYVLLSQLPDIRAGTAST